MKSVLMTVTDMCSLHSLVHVTHLRVLTITYIRELVHNGDEPTNALIVLPPLLHLRDLQVTTSTQPRVPAYNHHDQDNHTMVWLDEMPVLESCWIQGIPLTQPPPTMAVVTETKNGPYGDVINLMVTGFPGLLPKASSTSPPSSSSSLPLLPITNRIMVGFKKMHSRLRYGHPYTSNNSVTTTSSSSSNSSAAPTTLPPLGVGLRPFHSPLLSMIDISHDRVDDGTTHDTCARLID